MKTFLAVGTVLLVLSVGGLWELAKHMPDAPTLAPTPTAHTSAPTRTAHTSHFDGHVFHTNRRYCTPFLTGDAGKAQLAVMEAHNRQRDEMLTQCEKLAGLLNDANAKEVKECTANAEKMLSADCGPYEVK